VTSDEQQPRVTSDVPVGAEKTAGRKARGYRDLLVWQKGMVLAKKTYGLTRTFPSEEKFGLVSQMRRAAVSIPSNIAEGLARKSTAEFVQFISMAEGSLAELDTQLQLSVDLGFAKALEAGHLFQALWELKRMLNGLRRMLTKPKQA
jgi:four helix bundle protein